jgi:hypothetical protein
VAIALKVGRPKDHIRIAQFLEAGAVDTAYLCAILGRHGLRSRWQENSVIALGFPTHASYILPPMTDKYPDISDILGRKAEGRRSRAARTFAEKVADIEASRERLAPLKQRRAQTQHERNAPKSEF